MSEWAINKLEDVTLFIKDGTHGTHKDFPNGIPLLSAKDIDGGKISIPNDCRTISEAEYKQINATYEIEDDDILLTIVGTIGRVAIAKGLKKKITFQRSVGIIRINKNKIFPDYSFYFFQSDDFQQTLERSKNASAQGGVYLGELAKAKISHPIALPDQRRIAKILSTADSVIEQTQAAIAKYKAIKQGLLHDLFTRGIDISTGKLRPKYEDAPELYKASKLGWIPKEWEVKILGNICDVTSSKRIYAHDYKDTGIPFYRSLEIILKSKNKEIESTLYITNEKYDGIKKQFGVPSYGDILITSVGTLGVSYRVSKQDLFYFKDGNLIWFRNFSDKEYSKFLQFTLDELIRMQFDKITIGTSQKAFTIDKLKKLDIYIPKEKEYKVICDRVEAINTNIQTEESYLLKLQMLKTGLMADLLSGKKRVKIVDPE